MDLRRAGGPGILSADIELGPLADLVTVTDCFQLEDARGRLVEPVDDAEIRAGRVLHVHVVECVPGAVRANHVHRRHREAFCLVAGDFQVKLRDTASGSEVEFTVDDGSSIRIEVAAGVAHAFKNVGSRPGFILAYGDQPFDDGDFERCELLEPDPGA